MDNPPSPGSNMLDCSGSGSEPVRDSNVGSPGWAELLDLVMDDLRSPLAGTMLNLEMARADTARLSREQREDLEHAVASAWKLAHLLEASQDLAALAAGDVTEATDEDLSAIARQAVAAAAVARGLDRMVSIDAPHPVWVRCDASTVSNAVRQLIVSALDVTPPSEWVTVSVSEARGVARLDVEDAGARLPGNVAKSLFSLEGTVRIRQQHPALSRGVGPLLAGLAATRYGGTLSVVPRTGEAASGNVLRLEMPLHASPEAEDPADPTPPPSE